MTRVAVIGTGAWGLNYVRAFIALPLRAELAAVVDSDPQALTRAQQLAPRTCCFSDPEAFFTSALADAVVIASPAPTHAALAQRALDAGLHVLVEKPIALSIGDALKIRDRSILTNRIVMVGHLMLFHPVVLHLRHLVEAGTLGDLRVIQCTRVNLGRYRHDENVLWSFGPHDLSMLDFVLGQFPISVSACGQCMLHPAIEDVAFLTLRYPNGALAHVHLSWLHPRKERRMTLVGSRKMAEFDDVATDKLRIFDKGYDSPPAFTEFSQYLTIRDGEVHIPQIPMIEPLQAEILHFLDCIESGTSPRADVASAIRVTSILHAAQESMAQGGTPVNPSLNSLEFARLRD